MRRNLLLLLAVALLIAGITLSLDQKSSVPTASVDPAATSKEIVPAAGLAPDFSFTPMERAKPVALSEFKGRVVLLNFWASWCAPCVIEFPKLRDLARDYPDKLVVLAISSDSTQAGIDKFLKKAGITPSANLLIALDAEKHISQDLFQTIRLPETFIIAPNGRMVRKVIGDTDWTGETMRAYLTGLADAKPIP
jgi:thiol-disulfide isomerase/thioredoxin